MLKAIWPSIAKMPNHLPVSANITSSGVSFPLLPIVKCLPYHFLRIDVLLSLLAHSVSVFVCDSSQDPLAVLRKGRAHTHSMAGNGHMGICQGPRFTGLVFPTCNY